MEKLYILKHKEIPVIEFSLDDDFKLIKMEKPINEERLPFGLKYKGNEKAYFRELSDWIEKRGLPESRSDLANIKLNLGAGNSAELMIGSYALNLTDQYWLHKKEQYLKWEDVNFFDNKFYNVIDFDTSVIEYEKNKSIVAPDLTVDGNLRKKWVSSGSEKYLIKEGRWDEKQEPFNEVIASKILKDFNIFHVSYSLIRSEKKNIPLSICKCMVDKNTEFIKGQYVLDCEEKNDRNNYDRFIEICRKNGISDAKKRIDEMIAIDYIIGNTDRHTGNFGIIRNAESLEWLKVSPIFDNGNSLFFDIRNADDILNKTDSFCKWFRESNLEKLEYIDYPEWYDSFTGNSIVDIVYTGLKNNENTTPEKCEKVAEIVKMRIKEFERIINKKVSRTQISGFNDISNNK
jgi:hypothetical protein